jgi:D-alanine-D-alanine ligase
MPLTDKKIGVLMGGDSAEAEVSVKTGTAILNALLNKGYQAVAIPMNRMVCSQLEKESIEIVFNGLHGKGGEDGTIQGLLETLRIPYTGSGILASALGMNKVASRKIFLYHQIQVPSFHLLQASDQAKFIASDHPFPLPWVVKPCREGSSVGVSIVEETGALQDALAEAFRYDSEILIEPYIRGRELQVGILDDVPLGIIEIRTKRKFYDYTAKYVPGMSEHIFPAPLAESVTKKLLQTGLTAHRSLGCEGYSRVDFLLDQREEPFLLEVNTLPGMTETSLLPEIARGAGIPFDQLVERILASALKKK